MKVYYCDACGCHHKENELPAVALFGEYVCEKAINEVHCAQRYAKNNGDVFLEEIGNLHAKLNVTHLSLKERVKTKHAFVSKMFESGILNEAMGHGGCDSTYAITLSHLLSDNSLSDLLLYGKLHSYISAHYFARVQMRHYFSESLKQLYRLESYHKHDSTGVYLGKKGEYDEFLCWRVQEQRDEFRFLLQDNVTKGTAFPALTFNGKREAWLWESDLSSTLKRNTKKQMCSA